MPEHIIHKITTDPERDRILRIIDGLSPEQMKEFITDVCDEMYEVVRERCGPNEHGEEYDSEKEICGSDFVEFMCERVKKLGIKVQQSRIFGG